MSVCLSLFRLLKQNTIDLHGLNNKHLLLTALEVGSQGVSTIGFWEEPSSRFIENHLLIVFSDGGGKGHLSCLLYKGTSSTHEVSSLKV